MKQTKEERLQVRVTPDLKEKLIRTASAKGLNVSTLVLTYISQGLEKETYTESVLETLKEMISKPENYDKLVDLLQTKLPV